ncbi:carbohydrate esterase family 9 protein [Moniliophthora roreri MCA 2997]|uniref:Carbohydrate esterase family 9 protein n=1 Tax=Moniliophthora roreri (strain MCA 2997) TaxID=1381753 RepID=V2YZK8_MONRO|nr:carbohydrate esterase family 9 protein [Moniliophthora roreri MCA 2997]
MPSPRKNPNYPILILLISALALIWFTYDLRNPLFQLTSSLARADVDSVLQKCNSLKQKAGPPSDFHRRKQSDRFVPGTRPTLIKNAKIWTGLQNGTEELHGDILLDKGLIKGIGRIAKSLISNYGNDLLVLDAHHRWVTPGVVDVHSHIGDAASPALDGAEDDNSFKGTIAPWLRSLDGLNTHDASYALSISGGVTTSLVLPGSANAIGGQAFVIKLRRTEERSPTSMLLEPPFILNGSSTTASSAHWRHMKHACGENPSRVYSDTRMDTIWAFREAYNTASQIMKKQDEFCAKVEKGNFEGLEDFPEDLKWEALVDVLRGRVKVNIHCYEAVDLDALVRLSNEFKFPIAAFHHAHETYLVPNLLKKAYGQTPAVALFATSARYKREAYRASEFAPKILADNGIRVTMKSDHPVLSSRFLLYEAQQAHYYGLDDNLAIAAVTSNAAEVLGMGHRIGYLQSGWDADVVMWDSHPLALGATPVQVFIDGIPQLDSPYVARKPDSFQDSPKVPNFDDEARKAIQYDGLPPLTPSESSSETVVFTNVKTVFTRSSNGNVKTLYETQGEKSLGTVVATGGKVVCTGIHETCMKSSVRNGIDTTFVDLQGGSIFPALVSFGAPLGLEHINQEPSTNDGDVLDPLLTRVPAILGSDSAVTRAADGLLFNTRDALLAYRAGVTSAISAPTHRGFLSGLGTLFSTGASHKLEEGALIQETTGLHVSVRHYGTPGVSTQIGVLRRMLLNPPEGALGDQFKKVLEGDIPLVVEAHSADIIATLILLKKQVELEKRATLKLTITGGAEAHLLAGELAAADVGVVLSPPRPFPYVWEDRRILPGPPLTEHSAISKLIMHNVTLGIGIEEIWSARNTRFDVAWASLEANGKLSKENAIAIGSTNIEKLLGAKVEAEEADLVATAGGDLFDLGAKVVGVISPRQKAVNLF